MRVLIVEDDDSRMLVFDVVFERDDVTRAYDAARGVWWLERAEFDLVMLDHDLVGSSYDRDRGVYLNSGQEVAKAIARMEKPPPAIIHSWNPTGAQQMEMILARRGVRHMVAPFGSNTGCDVALFMREPEGD